MPSEKRPDSPFSQPSGGQGILMASGNHGEQSLQLLHSQLSDAFEGKGPFLGFLKAEPSNPAGETCSAGVLLKNHDILGCFCLK